ncbi:MAG: iron-sulfur cluster assembly accessory protein [Rhizobiales bacterium]|nr:iron-sulfur cluster assembly accessory protein [Hyphomicrobiales bacterium]
MTDASSDTTMISNSPGVTLSASAAKRIAKILSAEPDGTALRISVAGGGCSGFSYKYDLDAEKQPGDLVLERDHARVLIDDVSLPFLAGSEIDFVDSVIGQSFQIKNPNATASCGCGTSFTI